MQGSICPVLPVRPSRQPSRRNYTRTRASCTLKNLNDYANERNTMKTRIMDGLARTERRVISFAAVSMLVLVLGVPTPIDAEEVIAGNARVVDGDTIEIDKRRIRLYAIDAPEMKQSCSNNKKEYKCGVASKAALEKKIGSKPVRCEPKKSRDRYGRYVATCFIENKSKNEMEDLNAWMVARVSNYMCLLICVVIILIMLSWSFALHYACKTLLPPYKISRKLESQLNSATSYIICRDMLWPIGAMVKYTLNLRKMRKRTNLAFGMALSKILKCGEPSSEPKVHRGSNANPDSRRRAELLLLSFRM